MGKLVANIDDDVKARAAALYDSMGMSLSTAVNMFLRQSLVDNGLPFKPTRHTPDGYPVPPVHNAYMFERSEKGHVILPADWMIRRMMSMTSTPSEPRLYDVWLMWSSFPTIPVSEAASGGYHRG